VAEEKILEWLLKDGLPQIKVGKGTIRITGTKIVFPDATEQTSAGITEGWKKIAEVDVTSDVTSVTITGLDGDADKIYMLCTKIVIPNTGSRGIRLRPNGLPGTRTVVDGGYFTGSTAGPETEGDNEISLVGIESGVIGCTADTFHIIHAETGRRRSFTGISGSADANTTLGDRTRTRVGGGYWDDTTTNITSLEIISTVTNGIGAGSKITLFKLVS
jgi:hypothetical protein